MLATSLLLWAFAAMAATPGGYAEQKANSVLQTHQSIASVPSANGLRGEEIDYYQFRRLLAKRVPKTLGRMIGRRLLAETELNDVVLSPTDKGTVPQRCADDRQQPGCDEPAAFDRKIRAPTRQLSSFVRIGRRAALGDNVNFEDDESNAEQLDGLSENLRQAAALNVVRRGPSSFIRLGRSPVDYDESEIVDPNEAVRGYLRCDDVDDDDRFPAAAAVAAARRRCQLMNVILRKLRLQQQQQQEAAWPRSDFGDNEDDDSRKLSLTETKRGPSSFIRLGRSAPAEQETGRQRTINGDMQMKHHDAHDKDNGQRLTKSSADV